jgi:formylglycine-generating enzyme
MPMIPLPTTASAFPLLIALAVAPAAVQAADTPGGDADSGIDWVRIDNFSIARTETTVGQFRRYVRATGTITRAERAGGGEVYEQGWVRRAGWVWSAPFGRAAADEEPAVHVDFDEAGSFCRWAGGRLPTDEEWVRAAYLEQRKAPPRGFEHGRRYPYPLGDSPAGAQCLDECGPEARLRAVVHGVALTRGVGHARVTDTPSGVNGLMDMGGNAWEWVDHPPGATGNDERRTRGGSWWYGAGPMRADHLQSKPAGTTAVYIGFRCVR